MGCFYFKGGSNLIDNLDCKLESYYSLISVSRMCIYEVSTILSWQVSYSFGGSIANIALKFYIAFELILSLSSDIYSIFTFLFLILGSLTVISYSDLKIGFSFKTDSFFGLCYPYPILTFLIF